MSKPKWCGYVRIPVIVVRPLAFPVRLPVFIVRKVLKWSGLFLATHVHVHVTFVYPVRLPVCTVRLREFAVRLPAFVVRIMVFVVRPSFYMFVYFPCSLCSFGAQMFHPWLCAGQAGCFKS